MKKLLPIKPRWLRTLRCLKIRNLLYGVGIFLFLSPFPVYSQEITTTASPPRLELEALPGSTLQKTLKITNSSSTAQTYKITTTDFIVNDSKGTPIPVTTDVSGRWSLSSWLTTTPTTISIKPNQSFPITLQITIPKDALPGGHYAMVTYEPTTPEKLNLTGSSISSRVGTLIYLKIQGDITEAAYLKNLSVSKKLFEFGYNNGFVVLKESKNGYAIKL